jgi:hypothetical protein
MKPILIFVLAVPVLAVSFCAFAQESGQESGNVMFKTVGPGGAMQFMDRVATPIKGAPYSATTTSESVQTLADGNRISQTNTGSVARDSQGRTRQDTALPAIGNLSAAKAPHLIFIQDPVAGTSFTLNLTDKTAWKNPIPPPGLDGVGQIETRTIIMKTKSGDLPDMASAVPPPPAMGMMKHIEMDESAEAATESLGSQTMEGVVANGTRTTRTIAAGQIGNERPINIVTEVWSSTELKTIVSSKRDDPRMGEQTFHLTNIVRAEPDPSLFAIPSDFKIIDGGPKTIFYRRNQ